MIWSPKGDAMISIIIPTTGERRESLQRAVDSVSGAEVIVIVNGGRAANLIEGGRLTLLHMDEPNVSKARSFGLKHATGEFFGFLDDDDEYLTGALEMRAAELRKDPSVDIVVTNGYERAGDKLELFVSDAAIIDADPLGSFLQSNWFHSPSALFRRSVGAELFDFDYRYLEWTYLFLSLISRGKKFKFIDTPTYILNVNPGSVSRSVEYLEAAPGMIKEMMKLELPRAALNALKRKHTDALHSLATVHKGRRELARALAAHAECLFRGGWRYAPYTVKIFLPRGEGGKVD